MAEDDPLRGLAVAATHSWMAAGKNDLRVAAAFIGVCLTVAGCGQADQPALSYTSQPGSIDRRPDPLWGETSYHRLPMPMPEELQFFHPTRGLGIQEFADQLIGRRIAQFVGHRWDQLRTGLKINDFYPGAMAGPGPGMCKARRFQITGGFFGSRLMRTSEGEWLSPVYAVAGSLAPVPEERARDYGRRLEQACGQRTDMDMWFSAEPERAYLGARLADAVVAAARQQSRLRFRLRCEPYPPDIHRQPQCAADVRRTTASMNPRAILEVGECHDEPGPDCVSVQLAKVPRRSTRIEDRWTLEIRFDQNDGLAIRDVELADTHIIFE